MYEQFYRLQEKPFSLLPDPGFLYPSSKHQMALSLLEYSLMSHTSFSVVTGGIGTGKTTLIREILGHLDQSVSVGLISNTHPSFGELLQWILVAFDLDRAGKDSPEMYQTFVDFLIDEYACNRRTVLIIDEAQNMSPDTLEELRMLSNVNTEKDQILQIILVGQPGLRDTLRRPDLVQFAQRIGVDYHLDALDADDTRRYIRHRLQVAGDDTGIFEDEACDKIFQYSGGVPRLINLLCDTALVYGYAEQAPRIRADIVEEVAREKLKGGIFPWPAAQGVASAPDATPPVPAAAEPRRLRVAVLSDSETQRHHLKTLLEKCGMQVISTIPFDGNMLDTHDLHEADVLFVDLDENVDKDLYYLEQLLEQLEIPVLFNDSSALRVELDGPQTELRKRLTLKLSSLVAR